MNKIISSVICSLFLSASVVADADFGEDKASGPNWNYIESKYSLIDSEDDGYNLNAFSIGGSFEVSEYIFITGGIGRVTGSQALNLNATTFKIGGGLKYSITDTIDVYAKASYFNANKTVDLTGSYLSFLDETPDLTGVDASLGNDGYSFGGGFRSGIADNVGLGLHAYRKEYSDFLGYDKPGATYVGGNIKYSFGHVGVGVGVTFGGHKTAYTGKIRYSF